MLNVIFSSEKRKNVLLLLKDGPREMNTLLNSLKTTRTGLLPQIRILEEKQLVAKYNDTYKLTTIGKLIVDQMRVLIDTIEILDADIDYWGTHNFDFIPPDLLNRINELRHHRIIAPPITDLYSLHKTFHKDRTTEYVYSVGNIFYPDYYPRFTEMINNKITINYIVSEGLFDKIKTEYYENVKVFLKSDYFKLYVYHKKMNFLFFTFDDYHIVINPFTKDEKFDSKYILCSTEDALEWGKDLFEHYLKDSTPITEL